MTSSLRLRELALHVARVAVALVALAVAVALEPGASGPIGWPLATAVVASVLVFFGAFAFMHDVAHGALGLPRVVNELVLSATGSLLLMSGHALRRTHRIHHRDALGPDDLEGAPAALPLLRAVLVSPRAAVALRGRAFDGAGRAGRRWQIAETLADVAIAAGCLASGSPSLIAFVVVAVALQASMGLWAAYVPHNAPAWLVRASRRLAPLGSPTFLSVAYHDLHHRMPRLPCSALPSVVESDGALAIGGR